MKKALIISGTPGTGKTTLAKQLAKELKAEVLDVNELINEKGISVGYDDKRKCLIVDEKLLVKEVKAAIGSSKKAMIIDSHLSHFLPRSDVKRCIITKCSDLKELQKRLKKRGYSKDKIRENLDCEIFDICLSEAREAGHDVVVVDTAGAYDLNKIIKSL